MNALRPRPAPPADEPLPCRPPPSPQGAACGLLGEHPRMRQVRALLARVARDPSVVLVRGESGTGKERAAEAIHALSPRAARPLVKVNCGALTDTLLASALFGHERGAFTGAVDRARGCFELADGGTLFLDEVGEVSPRAQVALLRVLEEQRFERLGGATPVRVDVKVVCATNRDLEAMVRAGDLRADLFYRLQAIQIELPPLRAHAEDIPLIAHHLLEGIARARRERPPRLDDEALALLGEARWPGNVRQLDNVLRAASLFCDRDLLTRADLQQHAAALAGPLELGNLAATLLPIRPIAPGAAGTGDATLRAPGGPALVEPFFAEAWRRVVDEGEGLRGLQARLEAECLRLALEATGGHIARAAALLRMKRPRLSQLVKEYRLVSTVRGVPPAASWRSASSPVD